jgi:hypothetical protein
MRVECESCQELVAASFALDGDAVRASCPACRSVMVVPLGAPPDADAPGCPKCGAPRRGDDACPSCGLAPGHMAAYREARDAAVPESVRAAWDHAALAWREPARHDALLQQVAAHRCYAWAAGRYRTRAGEPIADRQLERLRRAAEATLLASATARPDAAARPYRAAAGVLAVLIVVIMVGLVYATVIREPAAARAPSVPARPLTPGHPASSSHPDGR